MINLINYYSEYQSKVIHVQQATKASYLIL